MRGIKIIAGPVVGQFEKLSRYQYQRLHYPGPCVNPGKLFGKLSGGKFMRFRKYMVRISMALAMLLTSELEQTGSMGRSSAV